MMHREVVAKRKIPVIAMLLLVITIVLYLSEAIEAMGLEDDFIGETLNMSLLLGTFIIILRELKSCGLAYKYAIIADKLIINKIESNNEENLESIKMSEIVYVGKKCDMPKTYKFIKNRKKHLCNIVGDETYYCIYKYNGKVIKFSFQPSNKFIESINKCKHTSQIVS